MVRSIRAILNADIQATDGNIGRCTDFLFDDKMWTIRYLVADTRKWLPGRQVLISPSAIGVWDWRSDTLPVKLTRKEVEESPPLGTDKPVSRQYEEQLTKYHHWHAYWHGPHLWGAGATPDLEPPTQNASENAIETPGLSHLRAVMEVSGYDVQAVDGTAGTVDDFLIDQESWSIRYCVVDTGTWLPGRKVLISPLWADTVDWKRRQIHVRMDRQAIENSPVYDRERELTRDDETALFAHYDQKPYWWTVP